LTLAISALCARKKTPKEEKMAHLEKFTLNSIKLVLAHNERTHSNNTYKNKDIDCSKTSQNYAFTEDKNAYERLLQRLSEVKVQDRADVKVCASWCVTAPGNIKSEKDERKFFELVYKFMCEKYQEKNIISCFVHKDETSAHMHCCFVPVTSNKKTYKSGKKAEFSEKVSAKEVLTKKHLETFHSELAKYVNNQFDYELAIITNKTNVNYSINELKQKTAEEQKQIQALNAHTLDLLHEKQKVIQNIDNKIKSAKKVLKTVILSASEYETLVTENELLKNNLSKQQVELAEEQEKFKKLKSLEQITLANEKEKLAESKREYIDSDTARTRILNLTKKNEENSSQLNKLRIEVHELKEKNDVLSEKNEELVNENKILKELVNRSIDIYKYAKNVLSNLKVYDFNSNALYSSLHKFSEFCERHNINFSLLNSRKR
jgi:hypothetical protein